MFRFKIGAILFLWVDMVLAFGQTIPIAILPFSVDSSVQLPLDISQVVTNDLQSSGYFQVLPRTSYTEFPARVSDIDFSYWQATHVNNLLIGQIQAASNGQFEVHYILLDLFNHKTDTQTMLNTASLVQNSNPVVLEQTVVVPAAGLRHLAHVISNQVYQAISGQPGIFTTHLAYVRLHAHQFQLRVSDYDGREARTILTSDQPMLTPNWSADGSQIAFVGYDTGHAVIETVQLDTGKTSVLVDTSGGDFAPAYSPDGQSLAFASGQSGASNLYLLTLSSGAIVPLTSGWSIATSPTWLPDSQSLVFVSNQGGHPQLYQLAVSTHVVTRLSFSDHRDVSPTAAADQVAYVEGEFPSTMVQHLTLSSGATQTLTETSRISAPYFSPDGARLIYTVDSDHHSTLVEMLADGTHKKYLTMESDSVYQPAWSPIGNDQ